jgi:SEC-C motif-containing protein
MPAHLDPGAPCACSSGQSFGVCCRPYLRGEREAPDPVALMRSRFSAFALQDVRHLWRTLHASHPDRQRPEEQVLRDLRRACRAFEYRSLRILDHTPPDAGGPALVLFLAQVLDRGRDRSFVERSEFLREGEAYRYVRGDLRAATDFADPARLTLATFVAQPGSAGDAPP